MEHVHRVLMLVVTAALLMGIVPHQSLYCTVMKRKIDDQMRACCLHHQQKSGSSVNPSNGLQTIDKPALSAFELTHSIVLAAFSALPVNPLAIQGSSSEVGSVTQFDHTQSPPDLVIRCLDLRI